MDWIQAGQTIATAGLGGLLTLAVTHWFRGRERRAEMLIRLADHAREHAVSEAAGVALAHRRYLDACAAAVAGSESDPESAFRELNEVIERSLYLPDPFVATLAKTAQDMGPGQVQDATSLERLEQQHRDVRRMARVTRVILYPDLISATGPGLEFRPHRLRRALRRAGFALRSRLVETVFDGEGNACGTRIRLRRTPRERR
jgi:hypothetical protein